MSLRREAVTALLLFVLVAVLFAPDAATGAGVFWHHDFRHHHYPWRVWAAEQWKAGTVPWWSSGAANGFPLLAEGEGGFLYPPTMLLFVLLPPTLALDWSVLGHQVWAALGMWAFLRAQNLKGAAPIVGGLAWGWSGFLVSHALYLGMQNGLAWVGWALFGATTLRFGWVALSIAMMGLAGHPQAAAFAGLGLGVHALVTLRPKDLGRWALAVAVGGLVASPQLLSSLELSKFSMRDGGVGDLFANIGTLPPGELLNGILPKLWGFDRPADVAQTYYHRGTSYWGSGENYWEMCFYWGVPTAILAAVGLKRRPAWGVVVAVAMLLMLGGPLWALVRLLPGFGYFRFPVRWGMWATFAVAVLAAYGVDRLRTMPRPYVVRRRVVQLAWLLGFGLVGGGLALRAGEGPIRAALTHHYEAKAELPPPPVDLPPLEAAALPGADVTPIGEVPQKVDQIWAELWESTSLLSWRVILPVGLLLLTALCLRSPWALAVLIFADLWTFGHDFHPRVPKADTEKKPEWLLPVMTEPGAPRTTVLDRRGDPTLDTELGTASIGLLWGTSDVIIPSPLLMLRNDATLGLTGLDVGDRGPQKVDRFVKNRQIANRMSVRWIASTHTLSNLPDMTLRGWQHVNVVEDNRALPRTRMVRCVTGATDAQDAFLKLQSTDPEQTVVVEGATDGCAPETEANRRGDGGATFTSYTDQRVQIAATGPGTLVLADSWFPGWTATVDGAAVAIDRADVLFRSIPVPEGDHTVVFQYDPGVPGHLLPVAFVAMLGAAGLAGAELLRSEKARRPA